MRWSSLLRIFFPRAKPDSSSPSAETSVPWEAICAYRLCDFPVTTRLSAFMCVSQPVANFLHVTLSVDYVSDFETYVRELVEAQFFSLWSIATMFDFLRDLDCVPQDSVFSQLSSSMFRALAVQA